MLVVYAPAHGNGNYRSHDWSSFCDPYMDDIMEKMDRNKEEFEISESDHEYAAYLATAEGMADMEAFDAMCESYGDDYPF